MASQNTAKSTLRCIQCGEKLKAQGTHKLKGGIVRYYQCTNPNCKVNKIKIKDGKRIATTTITEDGSFRDICKKIDNVVRKQHQNQSRFQISFACADDELLNKKIEKALSGEDFYSVIRQLYRSYLADEAKISMPTPTMSLDQLNMAFSTINYQKRNTLASVRYFFHFPKGHVWKIPKITNVFSVDKTRYTKKVSHIHSV